MWYSIRPNVLFTVHSIFHCHKCKAWYSCGTVMHEDLTQQEEGHVSYFTCLVARHLIKTLNVLMDDGEICAGGKKKTPHILKSAWAYISGGHYRLCEMCLLELFCLFRGGVGGVGVWPGGRRKKNCLLLVVLYCFQFSQRFEVKFSCFSSNTAAKYNVLGSAWHNRKFLPSYASKEILQHIFRHFDKIIQKRVCK